MNTPPGNSPNLDKSESARRGSRASSRRFRPTCGENSRPRFGFRSHAKKATLASEQGSYWGISGEAVVVKRRYVNSAPPFGIRANSQEVFQDGRDGGVILKTCQETKAAGSQDRNQEPAKVLHSGILEPVGPTFDQPMDLIWQQGKLLNFIDDK